MNTKFEKKYIFPIFFAVLGFAYDMFYQLRYGISMLNSDMSSEMLLSDILNKSHAIISKDWFYSTELHVFETQWVLRIGLLIFPDNWHYARTFSVAVSLLFLAACIILMAKVCNLTYQGLWITAFTMWPYSYWQRFLVTYGIHYIPYTVYTILTVMCVVKLYRLNYSEHRKLKICLFVFLAFLGFSSGLNGIRQFMVCAAPILLSGLVMLFVKDENGRMLSKDSIKVFWICVFAFATNVLGYLTNMVFLSKIYAFTSQDDHVWGGGTGSWIKSIRWFYEQFGYCQDWQMGINDFQNVPLFSFNGIAVLCGYGIGVLLLIATIYLIFRFKKLVFLEQLLVAMCLSMLFVIGFVTTYFYSITCQYWTQTLPFGFLLGVLALKNIPDDFCRDITEKINPIWKNRESVVCLVVAVLIMISSKGVTGSYGEAPNPEYVKYGLTDVVAWVETNTDYNTGVSEFWTGNIVTEISNGKIEMYTVTDGYKPNEIYCWLQKQSHLEDYKNLNHYFILCEYDKDRFVEAPVDGSEIIYMDDNYIVYGVN